MERALQFYCGVLGFELTQRYGTQAAFISAGGYHHHIGLNTWESLGGSPPAPGRRACITPLSSTPLDVRLRTPYSVSRKRASSSMQRAITASVKHFTCETQMRTASNFIEIALDKGGLELPKEESPCSREASTSTVC